MLDPSPPTSPDPGTGASRDRRERPKSFGRMRCDAEQGVRQVGGTLDGNQACGDQLSLLSDVSGRTATLIRRSSARHPPAGK